MNQHGGPCVMTNPEQFYVRICGCAFAITETLKEVMEAARRHAADQARPGNLVLGKFPTR
jgi:hypothetical protein